MKTFQIDYKDLDLNAHTIGLLKFRESLFKSGNKILVHLAQTATNENLERILNILKNGSEKENQQSGNLIVDNYLASLKTIH